MHPNTAMHFSWTLLVALSAQLLLARSLQVDLQLQETLEVDLNHPTSQTSPHYRCWTVDLTNDRQFFDIDWRDPDLVFLARALTEASPGYVRVGGTGGDFLTYDLGGVPGRCVEHGAGAPAPPPAAAFHLGLARQEATVKHYYHGGEKCLTRQKLDEILDFLEASGAPVIWALNFEKRANRTPASALLGQARQRSSWDPSEARLLYRHAQARGFTFRGFQLGNECNKEADPATYVHDYSVLFAMLQEECNRGMVPGPRVVHQQGPSAGRIAATARGHQGAPAVPCSQVPFLVGPDPHSFHGDAHDKALLKYLVDFSKAAAASGLPIRGVSHHEYIQVVVPGAQSSIPVDGKTYEVGTRYSSEPNLLNSSWLDRTLDIGCSVTAAVRGWLPSVEVWASEIGPHNGGLVPCGVGGRWANFGSSLWYLDALGAKAATGYDVFCRQDFVGIDYAYIDCATHEPLPDYYAALLWGRLMGTRVLSAQLVAQRVVRDGLRAYAHCARNGPRGGIVVLLLNLGNETVGVYAPGLGARRVVYSLTAADDGGGARLASMAVALNGVTLRPRRAAASRRILALPRMPGAAEPGSAAIMLPPKSAAFVAFPGAAAPACHGEGSPASPASPEASLSKHMQSTTACSARRQERGTPTPAL